MTATSRADVSRQTVPDVSQEQSVTQTPSIHLDHRETHAEVEIEAQGDEAAPGTLAFTTRCSNPTVVAEDADCLGQAIEDVVRSCPASVADARAEDEETSSGKIGGKLLDMLASSGESPRSPSSLSNLHTGHWQNEVSSRPAISQPQPMELQTRKYDVILQPLTSPHPVAQPCPSSTVSVGLTPTGEATPSSPTTNDATASRVSADEPNNRKALSRSPVSSHGTSGVPPALSCPRLVTATPRADVSRQTVPDVSEEQSVTQTPSPHLDHRETHAEVEIEAQGDEAAPGTLAFTTRCSNPTVVAEDADCLGQAIEDVVRSCPASVADARAEDEETSSEKIGGKLLDMLASSGEGRNETAGVVVPVSSRPREVDPVVPEGERSGSDVDGLVQGDASLDHDEKVAESLGATVSEVISLSSSASKYEGQTTPGKIGAISSQFWMYTAEAPEGKKVSDVVCLTRGHVGWRHERSGRGE